MFFKIYFKTKEQLLSGSRLVGMFFKIYFKTKERLLSGSRLQNSPEKEIPFGA